MDDLVRQGQWWWLIAVPVVAGGFALWGGWWGSRLGKNTEHSQWQRNEQVKVYTDFLTSITEELQKIRPVGDVDEVELKFPADEMARIEIVGSQDVRELAHRFRQHILILQRAAIIVAADKRSGAPAEQLDEHSRLWGEEATRLMNLREQYVRAVRKDLKTFTKADDERAWHL